MSIFTIDKLHAFFRGLDGDEILCGKRFKLRIGFLCFLAVRSNIVGGKQHAAEQRVDRRKNALLLPVKL